MMGGPSNLMSTSLERVNVCVLQVESAIQEFTEALLAGASFLKFHNDDDEDIDNHGCTVGIRKAAKEDDLLEDEITGLSQAIHQLKLLVESIGKKLAIRTSSPGRFQNLAAVESSVDGHGSENNNPMSSLEVVDIKIEVDVEDELMSSARRSRINDILLNDFDMDGESFAVEEFHLNDNCPFSPETMTTTDSGSSARSAAKKRKVDKNLKSSRLPPGPRLTKKIVKTYEDEKKNQEVLLPSTASEEMTKEEDIKLQQTVKVSLTRLEEELDCNGMNIRGGSRRRRAASMKATQNLILSRMKAKQNSDESDTDSLDGEWEEQEAFSPEMEEQDEKPETGSKSNHTSRNRRRKKATTSSTAAKKYPCHLCDMTYRSKQQLELHLTDHKNLSQAVSTASSSEFVCSKCSAEFLRERHLGIHMVSSHPESCISCPHCHKLYSSDLSIKRHIRDVHEPGGHVTCTCPYCLQSKSFKNMQMFRCHKRQCVLSYGNPESPKTGPWRCQKQECSGIDSFSEVEKFKAHMKECHQPPPQPLPVSTISADEDKQQQEDMDSFATSASSSQFTCSLCSAEFLLERHVGIHIVSCHPDSCVSCPLCHKLYPSDLSMKRHVRDIHRSVGPVTRTCPYCHQSKSFKNMQMFRKHKRKCVLAYGNPEAPTIGPWRCQKAQCLGVDPFSELEKFKAHMKDGHHPPLSSPPRSTIPADKQQQQQEEDVNSNKTIVYKCPLCSKSVDSNHLPEHIKRCKSRTGQTVTLNCPRCQKQFKSSMTLARHIEIHQNEDNQVVFPCPKCGKTFAMKRYLQLHLTKHQTERPYLCSQCPATFKWKWSFMKHMESMHSDGSSSKRVLCDLCPQMFKNNSILMKHVAAVHQGLRPYECDLCDKSFKAKSHLTYHRATHGNPNGKKRSLNKPTVVPTTYRATFWSSKEKVLQAEGKKGEQLKMVD